MCLASAHGETGPDAIQCDVEGIGRVSDVPNRGPCCGFPISFRRSDGRRTADNARLGFPEFSPDSWVAMMTTTPAVTVVTPAYNASRTIGETIESVLGQSAPDWEHIIVDDGSSDGTSRVVERYDDPRIRYLKLARSGRSTARNRALDIAQGENVLFLDADDWLLPNALQDHLAFLTDHPEYGVSVSDGLFCNDDGLRLASFSERRGPVQSGDVLDRIVIDAGLVGGSLTSMVRRRLIEESSVRFDPDISIGEDWLLWIRVACVARFGFLEAVTCMYRWHAGNTTLSASPALRRSQLWLVRQKVMQAPYFSSLREAVREQFFYQVLVELLQGCPQEQDAVMHSAEFRALTLEAQGRLMRLAASESYLLGHRADVAKGWLQESTLLAPWDYRAHILLALARLDPGVAQKAIVAVRRLRPKRSDPLAPPLTA